VSSDPPFGSQENKVVVIVCDCQCHLPLRWIRGVDQPIPPGMRPCKECASNEH